ncbi:LCP family protein [Streptomyces spectabilis]|uniref:LytR family transcriptional regulator n=1 Tax=Streptomyces spectabilis TaxID=68270 RepID=A0A516R8P2_STRST|nr:LCP family protein [Streptomyces spectabilis]QDQ11994.1 LytR family transcriptional regulator [Streptomyces spectabilis]
MSTHPLPGARGARRRWPRRVAWGLLAALVLVAAYGASLYFWAGARLRTTEAFRPYAGRPGPGEGTDWLLVGSDSRAALTPEQRRELHVGGDHGRHTDTIMLLHHGDGGPSLVSIPRDSYVRIPGHGKNKINAAYALGGAPLLTRTVEEATGLRLDHYAEVNFLGFVDVVDALGGVRICVPAGGLRDARSGADFAAGCQGMDGVQALRYVRARYADPLGDLGRVKRQRQLVSAVADRATGLSVLVPPWRLVPFLGTSLDALRVDGGTGVAALAELGLEMADLSGRKGATTTVPVAGEPEVPGVGDVVVWDSERAKRLFDALRNDTPIPTSGPN